MSTPSEAAPRAARKFVLDNVLVALAQLLGKLRGLATLPLLVRGLGAEGYGIWVQVISLAGIVGNLLSLNLHTPLVRMAAADRARAKAIVSTLTIAAMTALTAGCAVLALASPAPLASESLQMTTSATRSVSVMSLGRSFLRKRTVTGEMHGTPACMAEMQSVTPSVTRSCGTLPPLVPRVAASSL